MADACLALLAPVTPAFTMSPIDEATHPLVERLWQLYRHDLPEFRGLHGLCRFLADDPGERPTWRRLCAEVVHDGVCEELRSVPGKPDVPPDAWLTLTVVRGSEPQRLSR